MSILTGKGPKSHNGKKAMFARRSSDAATTEADIEIPDSWGCD
jgi:hypothetical protein